MIINIIIQVITEMHTLGLVKDYVISCYNHPERGDYNTKELIFKIDAKRFLNVSEGETNKMKETAVAPNYYHSPRTQ